MEVLEQKRKNRFLVFQIYDKVEHIMSNKMSSSLKIQLEFSRQREITSVCWEAGLRGWLAETSHLAVEEGEKEA